MTRKTKSLNRSKLSSSVVKEVGVSAISTGVPVPISAKVGIPAVAVVVSTVTTVSTGVSVTAVTTMTALIRNLRALI